jgi:hypothetical protein
MDVGFYDGAVNAYPAALFNCIPFGVLYDTAIDRFPGSRRQGLDVFTQY